MEGPERRSRRRDSPFFLGGESMKLKYLGHAAFEVTLAGGNRIVFDPYESGSYDGALAYGPIEGAYDHDERLF